MHCAAASSVSISRQAGGSALQMGGRLAWNSIKVYKEAKFGAATRALVRRGVGELADPVVVADLKPATTAEHKLCSPNLTKVGLMVARRIGEQAVNATHDTNKTGLRGVTAMRKACIEAMNALCLRKANATSGTGVSSLKGIPRMVITSEIMEMVGNISPDVDHNCAVLIAKPMETVGEGGFLTNRESTSDYDKQMVEERLAKDSGGIGAVKIGGGDADGAVENDNITDAQNAAKSGVEEAIVPGNPPEDSALPLPWSNTLPDGWSVEWDSSLANIGLFE